jgi:cell division protein FtsI (penicillin-binding protein 3)
LVCVVLINEPKGESYGGGATAAPVFSRVMQNALRILNVPPKVQVKGEAA